MKLTALAGVFFLRKITYNVRTVLVDFRNDIKQKGSDIKIQSLVIQKQLAEQTQTLAVCPVILSIQFICCYITMTINLISWGLSARTIPLVSSVGSEFLHVRQAILAHIKSAQIRISIRKGTVVPGFHFPIPHDNFFDIFNLGCLFVLSFKGSQSWITRRAMPIAAGQEIHDTSFIFPFFLTILPV